MTRHSIGRTAAMAVAAMLFVPAALAQTAPMPGSPVPSPQPAATAPPKERPAAAVPKPHAAQAKPAASNRQGRVEQRVADLHAQLHITAAEEPQWRPFAEQMLSNARKMEQRLAERAHKFSALNAVENMQSYAAITGQHAENMQQLVPVFQTLYNALSPAQKRTADELWRSYAAARQAKKGKQPPKE